MQYKFQVLLGSSLDLHVCNHNINANPKPYANPKPQV